MDDKTLVRLTRARGQVFQARNRLIDMEAFYPAGFINRPDYDRVMFHLDLWLEQLDAAIKSASADEEK
jgi:hypothetical protein